MNDPAGAAIKSVHLVTSDASLKLRYFDLALRTVIPNLVFIKRDGSVCFETNELGLKGDPRDARRKLAVAWGDSVVFGAERGWPCELDGFAPNYQFLNGGIEGDPYDNILRRAREFNREHLAALNLIMPGWHPFRILEDYRDRPRSTRLDWLGGALTHLRPAADERGRFRAALAAALPAIPNAVVLTMPTALNPALLGGDLSRYFRDDVAESFSFCGQLPYASGIQEAAYQFILERNALTREVCSETRVPLVDLFAVFDTSRADDFRRYFHDIVHFRPSAYAEVAKIVFEAIRSFVT